MGFYQKLFAMIHKAEFINIDDHEHWQARRMFAGVRFVVRERETQFMGIVANIFEDVIRSVFCSTKKRVLKYEERGQTRYKEYDIAIHTPKTIYLGEIKTSKGKISTGAAFRQMKTHFLEDIGKEIVFFVVRIVCHERSNPQPFIGRKFSISEISDGTTFCFHGKEVWDFAIKNGFSKNESLYERAISQILTNDEDRELVTYVDESERDTFSELPGFESLKKANF